MWDIGTGEEIITLPGHSRSVNGCTISPDGTRVFSASADGAVKAWDLETGKCLATLAVDGPLSGCAVSPNGIQVVAVGTCGVYFLRLVL